VPGLALRALHISWFTLLGQQTDLNPRGIHYRHHSIQDGELSSVPCHSILFIDNGQPFANQTIKKTTFATIGQANQGHFELLCFLLKHIPLLFGLLLLVLQVKTLDFLRTVHDQLFGSCALAELECQTCCHVA
jgi:hypothetical protein